METIVIRMNNGDAYFIPACAMKEYNDEGIVELLYAVHYVIIKIDKDDAVRWKRIEYYRGGDRIASLTKILLNTQYVSSVEFR